jgi:uncharacterized protein (DUF433 family)
MIEIHQDAVPLTVWEDGSIRIGKTRMLLYLVVEAFELGNNPESLVEMFPSLNLADTYAVLAYYFRHKEELTEYFRKQDEVAEQELREFTSTPAYQAQLRKLREFKAERERQHEKARQ